MKGQREYDLSEEYILECTTKFSQNYKKINATSDCSGGYVDYAS